MKKEFNFTEVEREFRLLKKQYQLRLITLEEYKRKLKELRIKDQNGRCWTLGARSGKWYYFDGEKWVESQPPSLAEKKAICIYCGYENDLDNEACAFCGSGLKERERDVDSHFSVFSGKKAMNPSYPESSIKKTQETTFLGVPDGKLIIKGISLLPFILLWGIIGAFLGMISGIMLGVMNLPLTLISQWPTFLQGIQGNLYGGILFGLAGAILGMLAFSLLGALGALLINISFSLFGGLTVRGKWH